MWFLYNILFFVYSLFALPFFIAKGKLSAGASSRFGRIPEEIQRQFSGEAVWWIHAVSVGEIALAVRFADRLRSRIQGIKILITTTTTTGFEVGQKIKSEEDFLLYFPLDFAFSVRRFIRQASPAALILFETELWPNLIRELSRRLIPVFLVNARISDRAFPKYLRARFFIKKVLQKISFLSVQDERMRSRFVELGADPGRVRVGGNMKYDWEPSLIQEEAALPPRRALKSLRSFIFIAGSTHEGEEEILFRIYSSLKAQFPAFRMVVAPRHLTRVQAIQKTAERFHVNLFPLSALRSGEKIPESAAVFLLDEIGVLASLYEAADLVFVGGSLVTAGGHNLVEPAVHAKAILFGPRMQNFSQMADEFEKARAALCVKDEEELKKEIGNLILNADKLRLLGEAAQNIARRHQGASERNLNHVLSFMDSNERSFVRV